MGVISPYTIAIGRMIFLSKDLFISWTCLFEASKGSDMPSSRGTRQALKKTKIMVRSWLQMGWVLMSLFAERDGPNNTETIAMTVRALSDILKKKTQHPPPRKRRRKHGRTKQK